MSRHFIILVIRWLGNSLGLAIFAAWSSLGLHLAPGWQTLLTASLVFTLVNLLLRTIITFIALPFLFITLGFFSLLLNSLMVFLADLFYGGLVIENWWSLAVVGAGLAVINYLITICFRQKRSAI